MRKKICTLFLLLVLAIQILPIQQMGGLLFSNQLTEEIPHAQDTDSGFYKKAAIKSDYLSSAGCKVVSAFIVSAIQHPDFADAIPLNHAPDIHVPPPNC